LLTLKSNTMKNHTAKVRSFYVVEHIFKLNN